MSFADPDYEENSSSGKYLTFALGQETYALEIAYVTEVIGTQVITPLPDTPPHIRGVIDLRGRVLPVMDVRMRFGLEERAYGDRTCIIVIHARETTTGLVVDTVNDVLDIPTERIEPIGQMAVGTRKGRFIKGLGRIDSQIKIILDAETLVFDNSYDSGQASGGTI
jgi:purine-binding chemotaxis protein CheW